MNLKEELQNFDAQFNEDANNFLEYLRNLSTLSSTDNSGEVTRVVVKSVEDLIGTLVNRRLKIEGKWDSKIDFLHLESTSLESVQNLQKILDWFVNVGFFMNDREWCLIRYLSRFVKVGEIRLNNNKIGNNLQETELALGDLMSLIDETRIVQDGLIILSRASSTQNNQQIHERVKVAQSHCSKFTQRSEDKRRCLNQAVIFYSELDIVRI